MHFSIKQIYRNCFFTRFAKEDPKSREEMLISCNEHIIYQNEKTKLVIEKQNRLSQSRSPMKKVD